MGLEQHSMTIFSPDSMIVLMISFMTVFILSLDL